MSDGPYIGAHVSAAGGVQHTPGRAAEIGANAFALFVKNQRRWVAPATTPDQAQAFKANLADAAIDQRHVMIHDSYLINVANPEPEKRRKSIDALLDEARRAELLGLTLLNFHPGSGLGELSVEETIEAVAQAMAEVLQQTESVVLVVENTAGGGTHIGRTFEEIAGLIELGYKYAGAAGKGPQVGPGLVAGRIGTCLDTCHLFAAGYDLRTDETYATTMQEFGAKVGFEYLLGMHINDAKSELGSRLDRHDSIGEGNLGSQTFARVVSDPRVQEIPLVLETPAMDRWASEISMLRGFAESKET